MRIFENFIEADKEVEREINHNGIVYQTQTWQNKYVAEKEEFKTRELLGYSFLVKNPGLDSYIEYRKLNRDWIIMEFQERMSRKRFNPGQAWKLRSETWKEFLVPDDGDGFGHFDYTYSERIGDQVYEVTELLRKIPYTRHALIFIYNPEIDNKKRDGSVRVPCSIYYNFFIRDTGEGEQLHMIYNIRSNDYYGHFPYDLILARMLQQFIADQIGVIVGDFLYQSGSLHCFKKDDKEIF